MNFPRVGIITAVSVSVPSNPDLVEYAARTIDGAGDDIAVPMSPPIGGRPARPGDDALLRPARINSVCLIVEVDGLRPGIVVFDEHFQLGDCTQGGGA